MQPHQNHCASAGHGLNLQDGGNIIALQTAAGADYEAMLRETEKVTRLYCSRHRIEYRQFVGIKRGYFPWHACFNRIVMLKELLAREAR